MNKLIVPSAVTVGELSELVSHPPKDVITYLLEQGTMATLTQSLDEPTARSVAEHFGFEVAAAGEHSRIRHPALDVSTDDPALLVARPPIVTVLGHVDHGKTSLLDAIRETNVARGEAGGITQRIGAYQIEKGGRRITFIDTPGHEAFTAMRARGADVTDVAVLVVAADDGIMPQTEEAIQHARTAEVPIVVALNKVDRDNANPDRVLQQLADRQLVSEEYGGDTTVVRTSAKTGLGIDELLEMILLVADISDPKANPSRRAAGTIIDSHMEKGRGPLATVLVQNGTLHVGDAVVAGSIHGRVRSLVNDRGEKVESATPGTPVVVMGLSDVGIAGDIFEAVDNEKTARGRAAEVAAQLRRAAIAPARRITLADLAFQVAEGKTKRLNLVVKAEANGSLEALHGQIVAIDDPNVTIKIVGEGVGPVTESDVNLAAVSSSIIIGFNVRPEATARALAEAEGVDVRYYDVVYQVTEDLDKAVHGLYEPVFVEVSIGKVEVRKVFTVDGKAAIAGSHVIEGKISRNALCRVTRRGEEIAKEAVAQLKRGRDDVREVQNGYDCGITLENFAAFEEGDLISAYVVEQQNG